MTRHEQRRFLINLYHVYRFKFNSTHFKAFLNVYKWARQFEMLDTVRSINFEKEYK